MKKIFVIAMVVVLSATAQFKQRPTEEPKVSDSFIQPQSQAIGFRSSTLIIFKCITAIPQATHRLAGMD